VRARGAVGYGAAALGALFVLLGLAGAAHGAEAAALPGLRIDLGDSPGRIAGVLEVLLVLTVLTLAPGILVLMTSFTRIAVVLAFVRQALGTQQSPPTQILVGLALFLTVFVMQPVGEKVWREAVVPYRAEALSGEQFLERAAAPVKDFMMRQTRKKDLALFLSLSREGRPEKPEDVPLSALVPAFVISELKTAFQIGFMLYVPFLVLDMVISSVLLSMGMMMLPPVMISLPFKVMLFVLVDGWNLLVGSLVRSFN